jgi:hypothetical protein
LNKSTKNRFFADLVNAGLGVIAYSLSFSAFACDVIDSKFQSVGELISENTQSQIGNPRSLIRLIGPPVNDKDPGPDAKLLYLRVDIEKNQLTVSNVLGIGELGKSIAWEVVCDDGRWLIDTKGKGSTEGVYQKYNSKIWLNITSEDDLQVEHHYSNVSGLIFHDYYYYEAIVKFKKQ